MSKALANRLTALERQQPGTTATDLNESWITSPNSDDAVLLWKRQGDDGATR